MNSIARALNNIAISLNSIASAINNSKKVETKNTTITSNPASAVAVTSFVQSGSFEKVSIPKEEKEAIDAIYDALIVKGNHPEHHDHVVRELRTKWPVLFKALDRLTVVRKKHYNKTTDYDVNKQIWKSKHSHKWL